MSDFMGDIGSLMALSQSNAAGGPAVKKNDGGLGLNMQDFLTLMVTELQNQSMDSTADTSEMLNQMVMMQMVSALTNMTDASVMSYAASLVGKTVTIGQVNAEGKVDEIVGTVTGTGTMNGQQVVFVGDKYYYMNEIMAVGTLPPKTENPEKPADPTTPEKPQDPVTPEIPEEPKKPEIPEKPADPVVPEKPQDPKTPEKPIEPKEPMSFQAQVDSQF